MPYENTVPVITPIQHASETCLATPEGRKGFWRAIFSCWLGTTMEYADFALYGLAAGIIFTDVFFPETAPMIALLASFATYSVGFVARPIGALMFGWLGDRKGRKFVMLMTVTLMGISTTLIGLIPGYALIGILAPICLVTLRFIQGLGAGAALSGGTAPLVAAALLSFRGHWWPIACYFAVMAGIGFITTFFAPETRGRDLNLLEDAI
ncbi:MFS transporter [Xenorhabdus sp. SGI246]|uniref:MFS transporter n=1 Tax=Xenorhabdus sp. SGI246 TaxID=3158263 RepID=UPI00349F2737